MYKTTFRPPPRREKRRQRQVKYKITLFFASYKLFQYDRSSFDFFCNFVGREGGVSDMRFHQNVGTCLWLVSNALTHCRLMQICHPPQYAESLNLIRMVARILKLNRFFLEL